MNPYALPAAAFPVFFDEQTIAFISRANPDGLNPDGGFRPFLVNTDGGSLRALSIPVPLPGAKLNPTFSITSARREVTQFFLPGTPANRVYYFDQISEIFVFDHANLLQLTNFDRVDTLFAFLGVDRQRAFFFSSANPFGTNPSENCQLFSVDPLGGDLRQVTNFRKTEQEHSENGCLPGPGPGCAASPINLFNGTSQDARTGALLFDSSCDPLGTNPDGGLLFAVNPDGTGLRQLTDTRGIVRADGGTLVEFPGPYEIAMNL
jgi:hypothetical protein